MFSLADFSRKTESPEKTKKQKPNITPTRLCTFSVNSAFQNMVHEGMEIVWSPPNGTDLTPAKFDSIGSYCKLSLVNCGPYTDKASEKGSARRRRNLRVSVCDSFEMVHSESFFLL